jgi:mannan endo-1,4-beta-mannosidase
LRYRTPASAAALACALTVTAVVVPAAPGQAASATWSSWTNVAASGPLAAYQGAMAYDSASGTSVLFTTSGQTWTWNGTTWTQQTPPTSPPARWSASMAYDAGHHQVVLFGGCTGPGCTTYLNDTWTWDGSTWTEQHPTLSPPARDGATMAYYAGCQGCSSVVLYGGYGGLGAVEYTDTWSWNGSDWNELVANYVTLAGAGPGPRVNAQMAYDQANGTLVLFGGAADNSLADTWIWSNPPDQPGHWSPADPLTSPPARIGGAMGYDPESGEVVLFGGNAGSFSAPRPLGDTWAWDGVNWSTVATASSPSPRWLAMVGEGPDGLVVFGGENNSGVLGDTWVWSPSTPSGLVTRSGSQLVLNGSVWRFSGANIYWLDLDSGGGSYPTAYDVNDALATAALMGARTVRVVDALTTGCSDCLEPAPGVVNEKAFQFLDYAIYTASKYGIRLVFPLVNQYEGYAGNYPIWWETVTGTETTADAQQAAASAPYLTVGPSAAFYTDPATIDTFEGFVGTVLSHVNSYTGVPYDEDPTILGWETGNEIFPPVSWTTTIASFVKGLDPNHLVIDGTYGINDGEGIFGNNTVQVPPTGVCGGDLALPQVDVYSDHFYPPNSTVVTGDADAVAGCGKAFIAGEYDWLNLGGGTPLQTFLSAIEGDPNVSGDVFWDLWNHNDLGGWDGGGDGNGGGDGYTLHYPGSDANHQSRAAELLNHAYAMQGLAAPAPPVPGAPVLLAVTPNRELQWQGVAGAGNYTVERSTSGSTGPWTVICSACATDFQTPWQDPSALPTGQAWYRLAANNLAGVAGPWSNVYQWPDPTAENLCAAALAEWGNGAGQGLGPLPTVCS